MIGILYGAIRSGKSYHAVAEIIIPALQAGQRVVTNISGLQPQLLHLIHGCHIDKLTVISDDEILDF